MLRSLSLIACLIALISSADALTVEGINYESQVTVEGQALKLVGAGLRHKFMFDVYTMGAYSASGTCSASALVNNDEPKYLRLNLLRDVAAEKMAATIGAGFDEHMPKDAPAELKAQRQEFQGYFKNDCTKGSVLEFVYLPGTGTILKQNGRRLGNPIPGSLFAKLLWEIYFGTPSCCDALKASVLSCGR